MNKALVNNFIIFLVNIIIPIILFPVLNSNFGNEITSEYITIQSHVVLISVICSWGFDVVGVKIISSQDYLERKNTLGKIVIFKFWICIVCLSIYFLYFGFNHISDIMLISCFSAVFSPLFYVQYENEITKYVLSILIAKMLYIATLFFIPIKKELFVYVMFAASNIIPNILVLMLCLRGVKFNFNYFKDSYKIGIENSTYMFSSLASSSYRTLPLIVVTSLAFSPTTINAYAIAEKLFRGASSIIQPISATIFPYILKNGKSDWVLKCYIIISIVMPLLLIAVGDDLISRLMPSFSDDNVIFSYKLLVMFSSIIPAVCFSNYYGTQKLIVNGFKNEMSVVIICISFMTLLLYGIVFVLSLNVDYIIFIVALSEYAIYVGFLYVYKRKNKII